MSKTTVTALLTLSLFSCAIVGAATASIIEAMRNTTGPLFWLWATPFLAMAAIVLYTLARVGHGLAMRVDPRYNLNSSMRVMQVRGALLIAKLESDGSISTEIVPTPQTPMLGPAPTIIPGDEFSTEGEQPEMITFYQNGKLEKVIDRKQMNAQTAAEDANRDLMLNFLRKCIACKGPQSRFIPGFRELGIGPDTWERAKKLLGDNVQSQRGVGTWLNGEWGTLAAMYEAVGNRQYTPRITVDHSHTPADIGAEIG